MYVCLSPVLVDFGLLSKIYIYWRYKNNEFVIFNRIEDEITTYWISMKIYNNKAVMSQLNDLKVMRRLLDVALHPGARAYLREAGSILYNFES